MSGPTRQQDAFGLALLDTYRGGSRGAVIERSDGFAEPLVNLASYFAPVRAWHVARLIRPAGTLYVAVIEKDGPAPGGRR